MSQLPARSKIVRNLVMGAVVTLGFVTLASDIYIRFHYAAVMPRSPQPQSGRIYGIPAQYGGVVYVNKKELELRNFVRETLTSIFGVSMLLAFILATRLRWFERDTKFEAKLNLDR
jgi:hypothetical protein